jgi:hypothetical protein
MPAAHNEITAARRQQPTFATKSAQLGPSASSAFALLSRPRRTSHANDPKAGLGDIRTVHPRLLKACAADFTSGSEHTTFPPAPPPPWK